MNSLIHSLLAPEYDALLIGNGDAPRAGLLRELRDRSKHVIAVDGGANVLRKLALAPDLVVGDLDSVNPATLRWARGRGAVIRNLADQSESDLPKALGECRKLGLTQVLACGLFSERVDHALVSLQTLARVRGVTVALLTRRTVVMMLRGARLREFQLPAGTVFSWLPLEQCAGCSLEGARWPFRNRTLSASGFYSLSNLVTAPWLRLRQRKGVSLLCVNYEVNSPIEHDDK
ncbi:thiamine diphosphokinase [candidate division KSB1 bacterium]|nr:thiamine diphosphokinase [candidate division KSB1 bacterium]